MAVALTGARDRREALKLSLEHVAAEIGISTSQLSKIERGEREARIGELLRLAEVLRAPATALLGDPSGALVPLLSWVSAGRLQDSSTQAPEARDWLHVTGLGQGDFFALSVRGDSMDRVSPEGSTIIVDRSRTQLVHSRCYIFAIRGDATYKAWNDRLEALMPLSTNAAHEPIPADREGLVVVGQVRRTILDL